MEVRAWAGEAGLGPGDLFVSASTDEILSRAALHLLTWCQLRSSNLLLLLYLTSLPRPEVTRLQGSLWMPLGSLATAWTNTHIPASQDNIR